MTALERQLRLVSGLVLAVYVVGHFINHSLGIFSFEALEAYRKIYRLIWDHPIGLTLLYGTLAIHLLLALWSLFRRSTLRMPGWEAAQLVLGLLIPPLIAVHVIGTRGINFFSGLTPDYAFVITAQWSSWRYLIQQPVLVLIVWLHLVVGLHFWLHIRPWYSRWRHSFLVLAWMIPVLALLGYWRAGLTALTWLEEGDRLEEIFFQWNELEPEMQTFIFGLENKVWLVMATLLIATLIARRLKLLYQHRQGVYQIAHSNGKTVRGRLGQTLLETLRDSHIPHASVCGGRARCTTCRVRIDNGLDQLEPPGDLEDTALKRIGAHPGVRLACQIRPQHELSITPLIDPGVAANTRQRAGGVQGHEREVVAMFVDLRDSTKLGEQRLPYDVVFILNQFFAEMAQALRDTNGHYAQFAGDGLMALYGLEDYRQGCRDALYGAVQMLKRLYDLNQRLEQELPAPLAMGIGLHGGDAIVGTMGPPASPNYSAIGDNINVAARLEAKTKQLQGSIIASEAVISGAGIEPQADQYISVDVRGRSGEINIVVLRDLHELEALMSQISSH